MVPADSRVIIEPTTLQMATVLEPFALASRCAAMVSAVSPDCEMSKVMVSGPRIGAIAPLAGVMYFNRHSRQAFDHELAGLRGMPTAAASRNIDLFDHTEFRLRDFHFIKEDVARVL